MIEENGSQASRLKRDFEKRGRSFRRGINVEQVLNIVKKNLFSIICGVVAIIAIIALQTPLSGFYTKFQADLNGRAARTERPPRF